MWQRLTKFWDCVVAACLVSGAASSLLGAHAGSVVWENLGLTSNTSYTSGSTVTSGGATMTTTWSTVTDGGTYNSGDFADFVTYNSGTTGNHAGLLLMSFYNNDKDQDDKITVEFTFDNAITNLAFTLLDIDDHSLDDTDDFIEVYYHTGDNNWTNLAFQTSYWTAGSEIARDNEAFADGWESDNNSRLTDTETTGNLAIDFNTQSVKAVRIVYYVGDDQASGPDVTAYVGISDLTYDDYVPSNPLEVTSTTDTGSAGTLRYAINYANANASSDDITFNIPGTGPHVITLSSGLPAITDAGVTIDGTTQSGASCGDLWSGTPHTIMVELDGPGSGYGITSSAASTTVKGLSITDFQVGVASSTSSSGLIVQCNYIGLNPDGTAAANTGAGLGLQGSGALIGGTTAGEGNVISSNYYGVLSDNGATGTMLRGNFIGTDPYGTSARANQVGVNNYTGTVTWSDISDNLISGNTAEGVYFDSGDTVTGSSGDFTISGNYIGLNRSGTSALANGSDGIKFDSSNVSGITIGGTATSDRNIISGNSASGISIINASDIDIFGNYIGLNASGTGAIGNTSVGIYTSAASSINIGNGSSTGRNVIAGNGSRAIQPRGSFSNFSINGNYVGTDSTGNATVTNGANAATNTKDAISFDGGMNGSNITVSNNVIGGYGAALLEFWGATASNVTIQGNSLGVGADGSSDISTGAAVEAALYLGGGTMAWSNFTIGGTGAGEGNIIANGASGGIEISTSGTGNSILGNSIYSNTGNGIEILSGTGISILQNSIYSNSGLGIDLANDGTTANDDGDADSGANDLQNFPVLNTLTVSGTTLVYDINLNAASNSYGYRIEFFVSDAGSASGYGEGQTYLGYADVGGTSGDQNSTGSITMSQSVSGGSIITATATAKTVSGYGSTSEFAANVAVLGAFLVTNTNDSGSGSLRQAITDANSYTDLDDIEFDISGTGPFTITISSDLPTITDAGVTIDGTTQSGASCGDLWSGTSHTLMIELDGPGSGYGITTTADATTIKGLSITDFQVGILPNTGSSNTVIQCNYIGLNPDGTAAGNTGAGVTPVGSDTLIGGLTAGEGNVISSNAYGILTIDGSSGTMVRGNFIGIDPTGASARANTNGINSYTGTVSYADITDNLISGNSSYGIVFDSDDTVTGSSGDLLIQGNYVGLNRAGTGSVSNGTGMAFLGSGQTGITIGGTTTDARNVISGNTNQGIYINAASDFDIYGNYLGLTADGLTEITNWQQGIWLYNASSINVGNGASTGRNVVGSSGNRAIALESTATSVSINGNYIGTDSTGNTPLTNAPFTSLGQRDAVGLYGTLNTVSVLNNVIGGFDEAAIESWGSSGSTVTIQGNYLNVGADGSSDVSTGTTSVDSADQSSVLMFGGGNSISGLVIGGTGAGEGNTIANGPNVGAYIDNSSTTTFSGNIVTANTSVGVRVSGGSTAVSILQNSIYSNGGIGIDLSTDGTTANDSGDVDTGANDLLNFPVLNSLTASGTTLTYDINLDAASNTDGYRIEFFVSDAASATGYGEGQTYIGYLDVTGPGADTNYTGSVTVSQSLTVGDILTVTATEIVGAGYGATSEFSANSAVIGSLIVTNTNASGSGSLAEAITLANANADLDDIQFNISGTGPFTISMSSALSITDAGVTIDGTTQSGASCGDLWNGEGHTLMIEVAATNTANNVFELSGDDATLKGLSITGGYNGVYVADGQSGSTLLCNYIGLNPDGTAAGNSLNGVYDYGDNVTIGGPSSGDGNVIGGNTGSGVVLNGNSGLVLQGNFIGVDPTGASARANGGDGVNVQGGTSVWTTFDSNLFSGNTGQGVEISSANTITPTGSEIAITGNYFGTDRTGLLTIGNTDDNFSLLGATVTSFVIGGTDSGDRNYFGGSAQSGVDIRQTADVSVLGNYIGVGPDGTTDIGNTGSGIYLYQNNGVIIGDGTSAGRNIIVGNGSNGIKLADDDNAVIQGNYVGVLPDGVTALANTIDAIDISNGSTGTTIGGTTSGQGNILSGNGGRGIEINSSSSIAVYDNSIGLGSDGTTQVGNSQHGIRLDTADSITIGTTGFGNVIVGNNSNGIWGTGSSNITIKANYIGLMPDGVSDGGNQHDGIRFSTLANTNITIGGTTSGEENYIAFNGGDGIELGLVTTASLLGNYIGSSADGLGTGGNGANGIYLTGSSGIDIGDGTSAGRNLIVSSSDDGVEIDDSSSVSILGNYIGLGSDGVTSLGNSGHGIYLLATSTSADADIGGTTSGEGNTIANNSGDGVSFASASTSATILSNLIHSNTGLPIDLGDDGVTDNDTNDSDTGANDLLNYPVLLGLYGDGTTSLRYELLLDAPTNSNGYRIEFFRTSSVNASGHGDATELVGYIETGSHSGGEVSYSGTFTADVAVSPDDVITATTTELTGVSSYGGTSEFALNGTSVAPYDFSDAPTSSTSYGSAKHNLAYGYYLGAGVTGELAAYDSSDASADTDDGTTLPSFTQSSNSTISVTVNGDSAYLNAWIDWNGDGDFDDTVDSVSENIAADVQDGGADDQDGTVNGVIELAVSVPTSATSSQTFARFRWTTDSGIDTTSDAGDGEVEDYALLISGAAILTASRTTEIYDPTSAGLYAIPGNDLVITISATNIGTGESDTDSIDFVDEVPTDLTFYNATTSDFGGTIIGWSETDTGLTFSDGSDLAFSNSGTRPSNFSQCTYTPSAGYDENVRYVCFNPKGAMQAGDPDPTFSVKYRVRIK